MKVSVVIPSYKVKKFVLEVISQIGQEVDRIYVVDDCCPEHSGQYVKDQCQDKRIKVVFHEVNQGVGGAVSTGYKAALADGMDVVVKVDGDGQMDPTLIPKFIQPIIDGQADYTKGNRFFNIDDASDMPKVRFFGNIALSFLTKVSSGYWKSFDPTNGYTAISTKVLSLINIDKVSKDYFFESDMLYRLGIYRAKVVDIPMLAKYEDEESNLKIKKIFFLFLKKNIHNFNRRIVYSYFMRDFSAASVELLAGTFAFFFGVIFGAYHWGASSSSGIPATSGTVMISGLSIIIGLQLLLSFLNYDIGNVPKETLHTKLKDL
ncbi:glycosyltransferase family 2 protein [Marinomonas algicola]|uniref:glycosyltransferase family 2 protein n=1 Tax=Marinomonas algicola TaxID=2773454 RepID=UPI001EFF2B11|nr:glycosyltransferase family 2 protein [Marinomonas algicola]